MRVLLCYPAALMMLSGVVVLDRVVVVVGQRVVKASDVERDLRVSQFLNRQPADFSEAAKKKAVERLIEQELIRQETMNGGYSQPGPKEIDAFVSQLRRDRFGGNDTQLRAATKKYGISDEQFRQYLQWQLTVLRFIDQRFRPGVLVTDEDVQSYLTEHRAQFPGALTQATETKIREILIGERVNQSFGEWLDQTKRRTRIAYRPAATAQPGVTPPNVTSPDVTPPEVTSPEVTKPGLTQPAVSQPAVTQRGVSGK